MKLKRKLNYKGHYMYQSVRPEKMVIVLKWLKENNPLYSDIDVADDWELCLQENVDLSIAQNQQIVLNGFTNSAISQTVTVLSIIINAEHLAYF